MSIPGAASPLFLATTAGAADAFSVSKSLRFNSGDSAYLNFQPSAAGNRRTWTWSCWIKLNGDSDSAIFQARAGVGTNPAFTFRINDGYVRAVYRKSDGSTVRLQTDRILRDFSSWYHILLAVDTTQATSSNRTKIYVNGTQETSFSTEEYPDQNLESAVNSAISHQIGQQYPSSGSAGYSNQYLAEVNFIDGQALAPTDFGEFDNNGVWQAKEFVGTYGTNGFRLPFTDNSSNQALGYDAAVTAPTLNPKGGMDVVTYTGNAGTQSIGGLAFQPDLVWIKDRTNTGFHSLFDTVRGATKTIFSNATNAEETQSGGVTAFNSDGFSLGSWSIVNAARTYVAWCWKAGGAAVSNTDGSLNSQVSANNDYGFSIVSYTGGRSSAGNNTVGHGLSSAPKLVITKSRASNSDWVIQSPLLSANKVLFFKNWAEYDISSGGSLSDPTNSVFSTNYFTGLDTSGDNLIAYCWSEVAGFSKFGSYTGNSSTSGPAVTLGFKPRYILIKGTSSGTDWLIWDGARNLGYGALAANLSNQESYFGTTNTISVNDTGFQITTTNGVYNSNGQTYIYAAFADRPGNNWTPNNLSAGIDLNPTAKQNFDVVTYTGNGGTQSVGGLAFQPDFIWCKTRSNAVDHKLADSVRGFTKILESNQTRAEVTDTNAITAVGSTGFTLGSGGDYNSNGRTYVAWCWKAGGAAVSNTDGSINSSVSVNANYGFSIVSYSAGDAAVSVGHGLSSAPKMIFTKPRNASVGWKVYHSGLAGADAASTYAKDYYLTLNGTNMYTYDANYWGSAGPNSTTFGTHASADNALNDMIAYVWSEVDGFSKFSSYSGNGSATGPVVTTGFKPKFLLIKRSDSSGPWYLYDSARDSSNPIDKLLQAESSVAEFTTGANSVDFLSNGFQLKGTGGDTNASGGTYIYAAYAASIPGDPDNDSLVDSPSNGTQDDTGIGGEVVGCYATMNPLAMASGLSLSNGNLDAAGAAVYGCVTSTIFASSGKYYFEFTLNTYQNDTAPGVVSTDANPHTDYLGAQASSVGYLADGRVFQSGSATSYSSYAAGDVIGVAFDVDTGKIWFAKNNTWLNSGDPAAGTNQVKTITGGKPLGAGYRGVGSGAGSFNFGQRAFAFSAPTNFKSLNSASLPTPTIADGSQYFDTKLYSGTGSSQNITGLNFGPDFVWTKARSHTDFHTLIDVVRGSSKTLYSNDTAAEGTDATGITAFNSDGYSLGANTTAGSVNINGRSYVGWAWDAGTSTVTNNDGSIASQVRANPSAGFSIVEWTGVTWNGSNPQTIGHGLNAEPEMIILKNIDRAVNWAVYHKSIGNTTMLQLNTTDGKEGNDLGYWNNTTPTSSVFTVGNGYGYRTGGINEDFAAYCFAPVAGYSAMGSYVGNGSADGVFVHTGFKVAFLLIKNTSYSGHNWVIFDTKRNTYNVAEDYLAPNTSNNEYTDLDIDILSNGFKIRTAGGSTLGNTINYSTAVYVYLAVAENPFQANGGLAR